MNQDDFLFSHIELRTERCDSLFMRRLLAGGGYGLHQAIWRLLPCDPEARRDFLYHRIDGAGVKFYVVSARELVDDTGLWRIRSKPYAPQIKAGESLNFTLRANPTVARGREPGGKGKSIRHDVVMDARRSFPEASEAERVAQAGMHWLHGREGQRAERHGYVIESAHADGYTQHRLHKPGTERAITFSTLDYVGRLRVTDPERFRAALFGGIGHARGFGCGLLLVRRV